MLGPKFSSLQWQLFGFLNFQIFGFVPTVSSSYWLSVEPIGFLELRKDLIPVSLSFELGTLVNFKKGKILVSWPHFMKRQFAPTRTQQLFWVGPMCCRQTFVPHPQSPFTLTSPITFSKTTVPFPPKPWVKGISATIPYLVGAPIAKPSLPVDMCQSPHSQITWFVTCSWPLNTPVHQISLLVRRDPIDLTYLPPQKRHCWGSVKAQVWSRYPPGVFRASLLVLNPSSWLGLLECSLTIVNDC